MSSLFFLDVRLNKRWGFVIYRTDYSSEEDWIKFIKMLETWCSPIIENKGPEEAPLIELWKQNWYMSDKDKFENATPSQLRQHFHSWLATLSTKERNITLPEHYMFLVVDKNILDIIHNISPERNYSQLDPVPYFMAFDKDGPDEDSGYPGAMKVPLEGLMYLFEEGLERDNMRGLCLKSSEWFKRDEIDIGETYAED
ncbi:hypothetical protein KCU98_g1026, partial [Aureobasidium melanogenum]